MNDAEEEAALFLFWLFVVSPMCLFLSLIVFVIDMCNGMNHAVYVIPMLIIGIAPWIVLIGFLLKKDKNERRDK